MVAFLLSISDPKIFCNSSFYLLNMSTAVCEESNWWDALILLCSNSLSLSSLNATISWYYLLIILNSSDYFWCLFQSWLYLSSDSETVLLSNLTSFSWIYNYLLILAITSSFSCRTVLIMVIYLFVCYSLNCIDVMSWLWWAFWADRTFLTS